MGQLLLNRHRGIRILGVALERGGIEWHWRSWLVGFSVEHSSTLGCREYHLHLLCLWIWWEC